jgi:hypothetical protein
LRQLPFVGKKSVPASLRRDLWEPMATISFPYAPQGLHAFRRLREYRKLHQLSYPLEDIKDKDNPSMLLPMKKRSRILMDQKANSIADIAAVLLKQDQDRHPWSTPVEPAAVHREALEQGMKPQEYKERQVQLQKQQNKVLQRQKRLGIQPPADEKPEGQGVRGVTIEWRNLFDAEYAEKWPPEVLHGPMDFSRHVAPVPQLPTS